MVISATFDAGLEGWTVNNGTEAYMATGGNPTGHITGAEGGGGIWAYLASAAFLGDLESYYGGTLTFDMKQDVLTSQYYDEADVILTGGGYTIVNDAGDNPGTDWTSYSLDLELGGGWRIGSASGRIATEAEIRAVLADLTSFSIRGEFVSGTTGDFSALDNVVLTEGIPIPWDGNAPTITSTFDTDIDGWSFIADVREFRQVDVGGNPDGYLEGVDYATGEVWYFVAAEKFLGDKSAFYGGTLSFDLRQSSLSSQFDANDVVLIGGGITLVLNHAHPGTDWTNYSLDLSTASDWRVGTESGAVATEVEIRTVLANLTALHIRGEYVSGSDTGALDNVIMQAAENVQRFTPPNLATPVDSYTTLEAAIADAASGDRIKVLTPALPSTSSGGVAVDVNDLTIEGAHPYAEALQLSGTARKLTLAGTSQFDVTGTAGSDTIIGNEGANTILGGSSGDDLRGAGGADEIRGGAYADTIRAGNGNDTVYGDNGLDVIYLQSGRDVFHDNDQEGPFGHDLIYGWTGQDTILARGGNDTIWAGQDADSVEGGIGDDQIHGGSYGDTIK
ncbi:laminin B domain-containing protein, partial [Lutimaribacter marinistellae]